jgi:hypothetical protein
MRAGKRRKAAMLEQAGPHRIIELYSNSNSNNSCVVMSLGSNNQFDFEESMHATFGSLCRMHTFDHTVANPRPPPFITYHNLGLAHTRGNKVRPLSELVAIAIAGDAGAHAEVLKVDIEGCKFAYNTCPLCSLTPIPTYRRV